MTSTDHSLPEPVVASACQLGESPLWHPSERCLYWVDIPVGRLHRWDPTSGEHQSFSCGDEIGAIALKSDEGLLVFQTEGRVGSWRDGSLTPAVALQRRHRGHRYNDALVDPRGRVLCGVMRLPGHGELGTPESGLYRLDPNGRLSQIIRGTSLSNGLGFTLDRRHLYHTDTTTHTITRYSYDEAVGAVRDGQLFVRLDPTQRPDGLTVDTDGFVWVALSNGGAVVRFDPDGREERRIQLPVQRVTSVAFGGDTYEDLYVTTAIREDDPMEERAGDLFRVRPGVRGFPEFRAIQ